MQCTIIPSALKQFSLQKECVILIQNFFLGLALDGAIFLLRGCVFKGWNVATFALFRLSTNTITNVLKSQSLTIVLKELNKTKPFLKFLWNQSLCLFSCLKRWFFSIFKMPLGAGGFLAKKRWSFKKQLEIYHITQSKLKHVIIFIAIPLEFCRSLFEYNLNYRVCWLYNKCHCQESLTIFTTLYVLHKLRMGLIN